MKEGRGCYDITEKGTRYHSPGCYGCILSGDALRCRGCTCDKRKEKDRTLERLEALEAEVKLLRDLITQPR